MMLTKITLLLFGLFLLSSIIWLHDPNNNSNTDNIKHSGLISYSFSEKEINCVAKNVYYEARGESISGQDAIIQVTFNRWLYSPHPQNLCQIVYKRNSNGCQFSWVCNKSLIKPNIHTKLWKDIELATRKILHYGNCYCGISQRVYYYHNLNSHPKWARLKIRIARIGHHVFYSK